MRIEAMKSAVARYEPWVLKLAFLVWCVVVALVFPYHEPWLNEAQAWLLARDASLRELLFTYLSYEGSPGLWHLVLMIPAKLGLPYVSMTIISLVLAAGTCYLILFKSPFPLLIKVLYPFSYFAIYEYAIIARSYTLLVFLLFLVAWQYPLRHERPWRYLLLIILLSQTCAHGFIFACCLMLFFFVEYVREKRADKKAIYRYTTILFIFGLNVCLVLLEAMPAPDVMGFAYYAKGDGIGFVEVLERLSFAIADIHWLSIIFTVLFVLYAYKKKALQLSIIVLSLLIAFYYIVYTNTWHEGVTFNVFVFCIWLTMAGKLDKPYLFLKHAEKLFLAVFTVVLCIHVYWSSVALSNEVEYRYCSAKDASLIVSKIGCEDCNILSTDAFVYAMLPYFDNNIFCNKYFDDDKSFYLWSTRNVVKAEVNFEDIAKDVAEYTPDLICMNWVWIYGNTVPVVEGYDVVAVLDSRVLFKKYILAVNGLIILKRKDVVLKAQ